jgi:hypothetical protein
MVAIPEFIDLVGADAFGKLGGFILVRSCTGSMIL